MHCRTGGVKHCPLLTTSMTACMKESKLLLTRYISYILLQSEELLAFCIFASKSSAMEQHLSLKSRAISLLALVRIAEPPSPIIVMMNVVRSRPARLTRSTACGIQ